MKHVLLNSQTTAMTKITQEAVVSSGPCTIEKKTGSEY